MKYYLIENDEKIGPFTIGELSKKEIYKETLIWTVGLDEWTEARNIPMLQGIISQTPPKYVNNKKTNTIPPEPQKNKSSSEDYFGYQLASRWERFIASLIDSFILVIPILLITRGDSKFYTGNNIVYEITIQIILAVIVGGLMYPLWSGNIGHKIFGIKVISKENGEDVNNPISGIVRELSKRILQYLLIPLIWLLWDKDIQNGYDKVSNTIVVKKKRYS